MNIQRTSVDLSVVIPTLDRVETATLLAQRINALFSTLAVETIIVTPATRRPACADARARYVVDQGGGVYAAYDAGLREATGEYIWLVGDDDYPLDAAAGLVEVLRRKDADVLVAPVLFSNGRVYRPKRAQLPLIFRNWCQQGVIYRRQLLMRHRFFRRFRVQADHYVNILLNADKSVRTVFVRDPICVFGVHGLSSREPDRRFRAVRFALAHRTLSTPAFLLFGVLVYLRSLFRSRH